MAYFFYVWLDQPEVVRLQRYQGGVDPQSFDGTLGDMDTRTRQPWPLWGVSLDLADPDLRYFDRDEVRQTAIIGDFFDRAYAYGRRLTPLITGDSSLPVAEQPEL